MAKQAPTINEGAAAELKEYLVGLEKLGTGDPAVRVREDSADATIAALGKNINQMAKGLQDLVGDSHRMAIGLAQIFSVLGQFVAGNPKARMRAGQTGDEILEKMVES